MSSSLSRQPQALERLRQSNKGETDCGSEEPTSRSWFSCSSSLPSPTQMSSGHPWDPPQTWTVLICTGIPQGTVCEGYGPISLPHLPGLGHPQEILMIQSLCLLLESPNELGLRCRKAASLRTEAGDRSCVCEPPHPWELPPPYPQEHWAGLHLSALHILQLGKKEFLLGCCLHQTGLQWYLWGLFSISD